MEDDEALAVKYFVFHARDPLKVRKTGIVEGPHQRQKLCDDAELSEESRQRTSTILMFVNTNVQMQKHILSLCYHPRKHV